MIQFILNSIVAAIRFFFLWSPVGMILAVLGFAATIRAAVQSLFDNRIFPVFSTLNTLVSQAQAWLDGLAAVHQNDLFSVFCYCFAVDKFFENIAFMLHYLDVALFGFVYLIGGVFLYGASVVVVSWISFVCERVAEKFHR